MDTVSRFKQGVHRKGDCGKNTNGFAAINSASRNGDLHQLGNIQISSSIMSSSESKKRTFACSDILAYLLMKNISSRGFTNTYMLLLSSGTFISSTVENIVSCISKMHNTVMIVQMIDNEFFISMDSMDVHIRHMSSSDNELVNLFISMSDLRQASVIVYPKMLSSYERIISECQIRSWCTPLSRKEVYVSKHGSGMHTHNVFPWSRFPSYSGFTIGNGFMQRGSLKDRQKYIGSFNFYESMISSVPLHDSCTDCIALQTVAQMISILIELPDDRRNSRLSISSIEALKELEDRIDNATKF